MHDTIFLQTGDDKFIVGWGPFEYAQAPHASRHSFFVTDFFLSRTTPWVIPHQCVTVSRSEAFELFEDGPISHISWNAVDSSLFARSFQRVQQAIADRVIQKAVPLVFEHGAMTDAALFPFEAVARRVLKQSYSGLYLYGIRAGARGQIGLSPELLFEISDTTIRSYAIAGTADAQLGESAVVNAKDSREHRMVVDDLAQKLDAFGSVRVDGTAPWNIGALTHLRTPITASLSAPVKFEETVRALHPSAALGTYPSNRIGWEILKAEDAEVGREEFGAPFGVQTPDGDGVCVVGIRSVIFDEARVRIGSGCGIIAESTLEQELAELALKRSSVKDRLLGATARD